MSVVGVVVGIGVGVVGVEGRCTGFGVGGRGTGRVVGEGRGAGRVVGEGRGTGRLVVEGRGTERVVGEGRGTGRV